MGNGSSKDETHDESTESSGSTTSRVQRLRQRLRRHRPHFRRHHRGSDLRKLLKQEDFAGIALLRLIGAEMRFKDKWLACVSLGEQTFRTAVSEQTDKPVWNSEKKLLLERNGARVARISVFETNRLSKNNLIGYCEIDLYDFLTQDSDSDIGVYDLLDPTSAGGVVGNIELSCLIEDPMETEKSFVRRILSVMDYDENGNLSYAEFSGLIDAFGNQLAATKKEELFKAADENGDGVVSIDELAMLLAVQQEKDPLINCCPVCGEILQISDRLNSVIHLTLCFDEGTGNQVMAGGFLTDKQASNGWMFKVSEWAHFSSYEVGLRSGSSAAHILVYDRRTKRLVEETIDAKIVLSMRAIYQSKIGNGLMDKGAKELLQSISEKQGREMDSPESAKDIEKFIRLFKMTKLAIIPCTVLLETLFFRKLFSRNIQISLVVLLMGVGIATVTDLQLNVLGSVLSLLAIVTTCVAQIMTNTIQKKFKVSSTQLLYQSCPYQAITLFITGPFVDGLLTKQNVFAFNYTPQVLAFIVLSCLISVSVNFSTFLVIGKTSPVTYQVLGHLKTCLVLAFGYALLRDPFSWRNILGILIAIVGMVLYSYCCNLESQQKASAEAAQMSQAKETESDPLLKVENGGGILAEEGGARAPGWNSNKDLHA